jgi:cytidylate kinase
MAIITISRYEGSKGNEIAKDIADEAGYTLIDKQRIHDMARSFKGNFETELKVLEEENKPGFFDFLFRQRSVYGHMISAMIYEAAASDNVVVVGRGGQFLFQDKPHVVNARLVSPFETRLHRIMAEMRVERNIALDYLEASDRKREDFIRYLYREDVTDPKWYDIIVDTHRFSGNAVKDFLVHELMRIDIEHPMTMEDKTHYGNLSLEKRVELFLMKEMSESNYIKVTVSGSGSVVLSGFLSTAAEGVAAENITRNVDGVEKVENHIVISDYPVRPWYLSKTKKLIHTR